MASKEEKLSKKEEKKAKAEEKRRLKQLEQDKKQAAAKVDEARAWMGDPTATPASQALAVGKSLPDLTKAVATLTEALEKHAENTDALQLRGSCYREQKSYENAIADFGKCIAIDSTNWHALEGRAYCFEQEGDWDRAILDWTDAVEVRPLADHPYCMRANARLHKRSTGLKLRAAELELVVQDLHQALRLNPSNHHAHTTLASCYEAHGMYQQALHHYTAALHLHTGYDHALYRRGQCAVASVLARVNADAEAALLAAQEDTRAKREGLPLREKKELSISEQLAIEEQAAKASKSEREILLQAVEDFTVLVTAATEKERKHEEIPLLLQRATAWMLLFDIPDDGGDAAKKGPTEPPLEEAQKDIDFCAQALQRADPAEKIGGSAPGVLQDVLRIKVTELAARKQEASRRKMAGKM